MLKTVGRTACILLCLLTPATASAQSAAVAGVVHDATGDPLSGARVTAAPGASGAEEQTHTALDGSYRLRVETGPVQVVFSKPGFANVERRVLVDAVTETRVDVVLQVATEAQVTVPEPDPAGVGAAQAASHGFVTAAQLAARPLQRPADILEAVPGFVVSQHSGEGKANQYYLRGFNLDHGTDFATSVAGMPANLPTHAHGHGYSDLNFLIPELVSGIRFTKGLYRADQGDFTTAGSAEIVYASALPLPVLQVSRGTNAFARVLAAASPRVRGGTALLAVEAQQSAGPWEHPDDLRKLNGVARYTRGDAANGFSVLGMAYTARWHATDQIPARAVAAGQVTRFGTLDDSSGGNTQRYSGSFEWQRTRHGKRTRLTGFAIASELELYSNFTYFLNDPDAGDQFLQTDRRLIMGVHLVRTGFTRIGGRHLQHAFGVDLRHDHVPTVALHRTNRRVTLGILREDAVSQSSAAGHVATEARLRSWLRAWGGIRFDAYRFSVSADDPRNSGVRFAGLASPKAGLAIGPWQATEVYLNGGFGFHSNDARGTTITVDPATGSAADRVTPLAVAKGAEIGIRSERLTGVRTSFTLWTLALESELLFLGDAGTTIEAPPSHRYGIEWTASAALRPWLMADVAVAASRAAFLSSAGTGAAIPGAPGLVASAGLAVTRPRGLFGSLRWRHVGPRPLVEDASVRSLTTSLVNLAIGYAMTRKVRVETDVLNLLNRRDSDVDYFYTSRLPGEPPEGVAGLHSHPTLPRSARVVVTVTF